MSNFSLVYSVHNLKLSWKRLQTGQNIEYKNEFRSIYDAYELGLDYHLKMLSYAIKSGTYRPVPAERIMMPKSSGLLRPISLLAIEDQIVYQAIANVLIKQITMRRKKLEYKLVYSHTFQRHDSPFMFEPWQECYRRFNNRLTNLELSGNHKIAKFDLSSYYETISHDLMLKLIAPQGGNEEYCRLLRDCLKSWTANNYSHGIPQGPEASTVLAELFLMPIDEMFKNDARGARYVRYVDDVRILGKNEVEVKKVIVRLDEACRELGLIPHADKFEVGHSLKLPNTIGVIPSLAQKDLSLPANQYQVEAAFFATLNPRRTRISDSSAAKFILYRARPTCRIVRAVLRLLPTHPELAETFAIFLQRCEPDKRIMVRLLELLENVRPYDQEECNYWETLSATCPRGFRTKMIEQAIPRLLELPANFKSSRLILYKLLFSSRKIDAFEAAIELLSKERSNLTLARSIVDAPSPIFYTQQGVNLIRKCLCAKSTDVAVATARLISSSRADINGVIETSDRLNDNARVALEQIGILPSVKTIRMASINTLLEHRFNTNPWNGWKVLFGKDYQKVNDQLVRAERNFESRSQWIAVLDSFNNSVIEYTLAWLLINHPAENSPKTVDSKGDLLYYGQLLQSKNYLLTNVPKLHSALTNVHHRRNSLPSSHARDKKTLRFSTPLTITEQNKYLKQLKEGYDEFFLWITGMGLR